MKNKSIIVRCPKCRKANVVVPSSGTAVCGECHERLPVPKGPLTVTDGNFAELVGKATRPVFLDFWAGWCGPCLMIGPFIEELAADLEGRVDVGKLNIDENRETARHFGVSSIPTMIIFDQGREVDRIVGAVPKEAMLARLQRLGMA